MSDLSDEYAQVVIEMGGSTKVTACFNDGANTWDNNNNSNYTISNGTYTIADGKITEGAPAGLGTSSNELTVYYYTGWKNPRIHYQVGSGSWTDVPGKKMTSSSVSGYKMATINMGTDTTVTACFNNGSNSWDNNGNKNYSFSAGTYTVKNGVVKKGAPK
jgi:alpha-amylase